MSYLLKSIFLENFKYLSWAYNSKYLEFIFSGVISRQSDSTLFLFRYEEQTIASTPLSPTPAIHKTFLLNGSGIFSMIWYATAFPALSISFSLEGPLLIVR